MDCREKYVSLSYKEKLRQSHNEQQVWIMYISDLLVLLDP